MRKILNWKLALVLIIFIAAFLRLWQLGNVPNGIPHDEASYIYNAYSIWKTGKDILGKPLPLSFNAHSSQSPVEVYLTAPFVGLLGLSEFSARLPSALLGIGSVVILFLLIDCLFKNKRIALIGAFLLSVSPWALQFQRGLWDANFGLFFMLAGIYVFVANIRTRKFLWSLIPFLLAFYSYHAIKVYFVALIPVLIFLFRQELIKHKKGAVFFLLGCLLIVATFLVVIKTQGVTRAKEVNLFDGTQASSEVNWERDKNTAPWILRTVFSNKPLYFLRIMRENYLESFSMEYLFLSGGMGNSTQIVNIYFRGELYIIELPFLLLGLYALMKDKQKFNRNFLFALLLISPLPSTVTNDINFVFRDVMMLPIILTIIAYGINYLLEVISKRKVGFKYIILTILVLVYAFLISEYLYQYYFRWPIYGAEAWGKSYRDLVYLIDSKKTEFKNIYVSNTTNELLLQYAILNRTDPKIVQKVWNGNPLRISNITMFPSCLDNRAGSISSFLPKNTLLVAPYGECIYADSPTEKIVDAGEPLHTIWNIYENK